MADTVQPAWWKTAIVSAVIATSLTFAGGFLQASCEHKYQEAYAKLRGLRTQLVQTEVLRYREEAIWRFFEGVYWLHPDAARARSEMDLQLTELHQAEALAVESGRTLHEISETLGTILAVFSDLDKTTLERAVPNIYAIQLQKPLDVNMQHWSEARMKQWRDDRFASAYTVVEREYTHDIDELLKSLERKVTEQH